MNEALITVEKAGEGYAVLTLNRPQAMNALSRALRAELAATVLALEADDAVRVLILTGELFQLNIEAQRLMTEMGLDFWTSF